MHDYRRGEVVRWRVTEWASLPATVTAAQSPKHPGEVRITYYHPMLRAEQSAWIDPNELRRLP